LSYHDEWDIKVDNNGQATIHCTISYLNTHDYEIPLEKHRIPWRKDESTASDGIVSHKYTFGPSDAPKICNVKLRNKDNVYYIPIGKNIIPIRREGKPFQIFVEFVKSDFAVDVIENKKEQWRIDETFTGELNPQWSKCKLNLFLPFNAKNVHFISPKEEIPCKYVLPFLNIKSHKYIPFSKKVFNYESEEENVNEVRLHLTYELLKIIVLYMIILIPFLLLLFMHYKSGNLDIWKIIGDLLISLIIGLISKFLLKIS
jgi:hypothetical protein